jgi:hypothetical protein
VSIASVMREQPAGLADRTLFEILLMAQQFGRRRLCALNARAVDEDVNLAVTLEVPDYDAREWVARNALPHRRRAPRESWARLMVDSDMRSEAICGLGRRGPRRPWMLCRAALAAKSRVLNRVARRARRFEAICGPARQSRGLMDGIGRMG